MNGEKFDFKTFAKKYILGFPFLELIIIALILVFDLVSKHYAALNEVDADFLGKLVRFEFVKNYGAAFSFLAGKDWAPLFFKITSGVLIPVIGVAAYFLRKQVKGMRISLALIFAGAVGNFVDRLFLGYVRDFIAVSFFPPIFNIADSALTVGVAIFIICFLFFFKEEKKQPAVENVNADSGIENINLDSAENTETGNIENFKENGGENPKTNDIESANADSVENSKVNNIANTKTGDIENVKADGGENPPEEKP